jgi:selenocysteine lyase/cysteine desulfurase
MFQPKKKPEFDIAFEEFRRKHPGYDETHAIDILREKEFTHVDGPGHVYLDFAGSGLYAQSQVTHHVKQLREHLFGNPHSSNPTSQYSSDVTEAARSYVLKFFNTNHKEYVCIFTQNASGALKILGESYPFEKDDHLLLTFDNHNSVNGIREFARSKGALYNYSPLHRADLRIDSQKLLENLDQHVNGKNKLFAFPAQSNASGVKHDLDWIHIAQEKGWDVLLDAAAFVPTNRLGLHKYHPDFVSISFYKIFGYPTGLGCLLVRRRVFKKLRRPWFAGGTIIIASVRGDSHYFDSEHRMYEDGTINFLGIPAIETGLKHIESIGYEAIGKRVESVTVWTLEQLHQLKHTDGKPLVKVYGPQDYTKRGGTIATNFFDSEGEMYEFLEIEAAANKQDISLRTGCFCNPGVDETNHALNEEELKKYFATSRHKDYFHLIEYTGKQRGAVRISFGYISNFYDAWRFIDFAKSLLNNKRSLNEAQLVELMDKHRVRSTKALVG